jgi:hypothetical protein
MLMLCLCVSLKLSLSATPKIIAPKPAEEEKAWNVKRRSKRVARLKEQNAEREESEAERKTEKTEAARDDEVPSPALPSLRPRTDA